MSVLPFVAAFTKTLTGQQVPATGIAVTFTLLSRPMTGGSESTLVDAEDATEVTTGSAGLYEHIYTGTLDFENNYYLAFFRTTDGTVTTTYMPAVWVDWPGPLTRDVQGFPCVSVIGITNDTQALAIRIAAVGSVSSDSITLVMGSGISAGMFTSQQLLSRSDADNNKINEIRTILGNAASSGSNVTLHLSSPFGVTPTFVMFWPSAALTATPPTASSIATAVWQDLVSSGDMTISGSMGKLLVTDIDSAISYHACRRASWHGSSHGSGYCHLSLARHLDWRFHVHQFARHDSQDSTLRCVHDQCVERVQYRFTGERTRRFG